MDMSDGAELRCATCGAPLLAGDRFCEQCGSRNPFAPEDAVAKDSERCRICGAPADGFDGEGYCSNCGARVREREERAELDLVRAAAVSDIGRSHRRNEDAFFLQVMGAGSTAVVVCDGISSASASNVAAQRAAGVAGAVLAAAIEERTADGRDVMLAAIAAANEASARVVATARADRDGPSCTLVSALCREGEAVVGWVGDSRAYWLCGGAARQLTVDDSWAREQVALGRMSDEEAATDPCAHVITRWVGAEAPPGPPNIAELSASGRGRLILCTDGLWNCLESAAELDDLVAALPDTAAPVAIARALADTALARGGRDDITVAVVEIDPNVTERDRP
jgi:serine/threonine protein phosphatase PrpC